MKITELRIGNLVGLYGTIATVQRADFAGKGIAVDKGKPIPLTKDWLLKFGFDDSDYKKGYIGKTFKGGGVFLDFVLHKPLEKGPWNENFTFDLPNHRYVDIPYVHQLQNLFYSLTGEELKTEI